MHMTVVGWPAEELTATLLARLSAAAAAALTSSKLHATCGLNKLG